MIVMFKIGTDLEYAAIQEFGGTITPKNGSALRFPVDHHNGGYGMTEWVTVASVTLPAQPYLRPAFDNKRFAARDEVGRVLGQIARAAAR